MTEGAFYRWGLLLDLRASFSAIITRNRQPEPSRKNPERHINQYGLIPAVLAWIQRIKKRPSSVSMV